MLKQKPIGWNRLKIRFILSKLFSCINYFYHFGFFTIYHSVHFHDVFVFGNKFCNFFGGHFLFGHWVYKRSGRSHGLRFCIIGSDCLHDSSAHTVSSCRFIFFLQVIFRSLGIKEAKTQTANYK